MAGPQRKPKADIYTVLLAIAFVAIIAAIVFLYLETADYGELKYKGAPPVVLLDRTPPAAGMANATSEKPTANVMLLAFSVSPSPNL